MLAEADMMRSCAGRYVFDSMEAKDSDLRWLWALGLNMSADNCMVEYTYVSSCVSLLGYIPLL